MNRLLKESKTSIKDLCKVLNVSHQTIHNYKNSSWLKIDVSQAELIANHLKVRTKDLIEIILRDNRKWKEF